MTWLPFLCLGAGFLLGLQALPDRLRNWIDIVINVALVVLMLTIGANIGVNERIIGQIGLIGFRCAGIAFFAILGSVLWTFLMEQTMLPLHQVRQRLMEEGPGLQNETDLEPVYQTQQDTSKLIWIMPVSIVSGVLIGMWLIPPRLSHYLSLVLAASLVLLYTGVGISMGSNKSVFRYLKLLGARILLLPLAICLGSLMGGAIAGFLFRMPVKISLLSAAGMSYYSITGAYLTQSIGAEAGTYGFLVNVFREFLTVLLLPVLARISKGAPIASGAAGNMDTMLVPVTRFIGVELGLVTLITGTVLTFAVPILLPLLAGVLV